MTELSGDTVVELTGGVGPSSGGPELDRHRASACARDSPRGTHWTADAARACAPGGGLVLTTGMPKASGDGRG